jgi:hypothetical protein
MADPVIIDRYTAARVYFSSIVGLIFLEALIPFIIYAFQRYNKCKSSIYPC